MNCRATIRQLLAIADLVLSLGLIEEARAIECRAKEALTVAADQFELSDVFISTIH